SPTWQNTPFQFCCHYCGLFRCCSFQNGACFNFLPQVKIPEPHRLTSAFEQMFRARHYHLLPRLWVIYICLGWVVLLIGIVASSAHAAENELVIISPHWEGIKYETER